ncbi:MAG: hypothetical protein Q8P44_04590, partial [Dehalococcoidia bacterium]|nr:hypothetical protein [Dehalococcoidia bacterium]
LPVEAIKMAIEKDGLKPEQVNGDTIYQALEKNIKEFDTGGLTGPLTISADNHSAARFAKVYQIQKGIQTPITGWVKSPHITRFEDIKK